MSEFFADHTSTVALECDDGVKVVLRQYVDAGIDEDIANSMIRMKLKARQGKGMDNGQIIDEADTEAQVRLGTLELIQKLLVRVEFPVGHKSFPNGHVVSQPIGMGFVRGIHPATIARIKALINEHNPDYNVPLASKETNKGSVAL